MKKIGMVSLGCPKNLVDTENLLGDLKSQGYEMTPDKEEADVLIVNTCGFLQSSVKESIDTILEMAQHKTEGKCQQLVVTGCLAERHPEELLKEIPEIDHLLGTKQYPMLRKLLNGCQTSKKKNLVHEPAQYFEDYHNRVLTTPFYSAYVKISEGCSNKCAFCIIPQLRGPIQSRPLESIVQEVRQLAVQGVREFNLISQDTTLYGYDIRMKDGLVRLLESLAEVEGVEWIRLLYCYPTTINSALINAIQRIDSVCKYIDVPLQHTHDEMLQHMKRQEREKGVREMIEQMRTQIPGITLRTTMITGFPGEKDYHFQHMLKFVEEMRFDHLGAFAYSDEPGTTAFNYPDKVENRIGDERRSILMEAQNKIVKENHSLRLGQIHPVLIEELEEDSMLLTGRMPFQAPEIDGQIIIENSPVEPGQIVPMKIIGSLDYDLIATNNFEN